MDRQVYDYTNLGAQTPPPAPPSSLGSGAQPPRKTNKVWLMGCFITACVMLAIGGIISALVFGLPALFKSNDAYRGALEIVRADMRVRSQLGEPIEDGWMPTGNVNVNGDTGSANMSVGISGPNNSGKLYIEATKSAGEWRYQVLKIRYLKDSTDIDLLDSMPVAPEIVQ